MPLIRISFFCTLVSMLTLCAEPLWAQGRGGGAGGAGGASTVGGTQQQTSQFGAAGGAAGGSAGGLGGGGAQGQGGGQGQFNPSSNFGQNGFGSNFGSGGSIANESGFVGRNDNNSRFIGSGRQAQGGGNVQSFQTPQFGNRNAGGQGIGRGNNNFGQQRNLRVVRPQLRVAFSHPTLSTPQVRNKLDVQLTRLAERRQLDGIAFELDDESNVTLRGEVPSEGARKLAEMMVRLEPGVRDVTNELSVASGTDADPSN